MMPATLPEPDLALAETLFAQLREMSFDGKGITRDAYGPGEQRAHDLVSQLARKLGFEVMTDAAVNLYIILPGADRHAPKVVVGSHLDSVPAGGNYDGAAGVLAGLAILAGWKAAGLVPPCDLMLIAIRAEESAWFPISYLGSKTVLGQLTRADLAILRRDNQISIAQHMINCGGNPDKVVDEPPLFGPAQLRAFLEIHIEQGPVLETAEIPVGIVSGICGSLRYRFARAYGQYAHSGACPSWCRQDAVIAAAELVTEMHRYWHELEKAGHELTVTFGRFFTDAVDADMSKVSGLVDFSIDFRSRNAQTLQTIDAHLQQTAAAISQRHGVRFDFGEQSRSTPALMDPGLVVALQNAADDLAIAAQVMPSGAGHDCAQFVNCGVPGAMLFVRNQNGSHNPDEAMEFSDFALAVRVLNQTLFTMMFRDQN
ncbi:Zn-dependent hydrolase [Pantoea cypripedii]|uniref:Zn-dependent hydrolase n=1 Tax=Pantoea cypripedii TaxID=55209 RepID=UPI002FCB6970